MTIYFTIPGSPVGKGRPKFARRGNFTVAYTPEKTASYENLVKIMAHKAMQGRDPITGPVCVDLSIYITPPASWSKKRQQAAINGEIIPTVKPDVDNVLKGICDACNGIVWLDDKQASDGSFKRRYASTARVEVHINTVTIERTAD